MDPLPITSEEESPEVAPRPPSEGVPELLTDLASKVIATKEGETFLYSDTEGNLDDRKEFGLGLYHRDTRFLSHYRMKLSGRDPVLLSSSGERGYLSAADLTNPDLYDDDQLAVPQQTLNIRRVRVIAGQVYERIRIKNYNASPVRLTMSFSMAADFADIFEVRGLKRPTRGHYKPPRASGSKVEFAYQGVDGVIRRTAIEFSPKPDRLEVVGDRVEIDFGLHLAPHQTRVVAATFDLVVGKEQIEPADFDTAVHRLRRSYEDWERECTQIVTDNEVFNNLLERGLRDLRALYTRSDGGQILAAGIPWYVAVFGRDALITSHQLLDRDDAAGARRAEAAGQAPGHEGGRLARRGAREDPPRDPPRRAGRRRPDPALALLRQRRLHAVVRPAVRAVLPVDRRPRDGRGAAAERPRRARMDRPVRRHGRRRVRRVPHAVRRRAGEPGVEGLVGRRGARRRDARRRARSRSPRSRPTCTWRSSGPRTSSRTWATSGPGCACARRPPT